MSFMRVFIKTNISSILLIPSIYILCLTKEKYTIYFSLKTKFIQNNTITIFHVLEDKTKK